MKTIAQKMGWLLPLVPLVSFLVETITYPGFFKLKLGISQDQVTLITLLPLIAFMLQKQTSPLHPLIRRFIYPFIVFLTLTLFLGVYIENGQYPNYIFSTLHLSLRNLVSLSLATFMVVLMSLATDFKKIKLKQKLVLIFLPATVFSWAYYFQSTDFAVYQHITGEDGVVEYAQFFLMLGSAWITYLLAVTKNKTQTYLRLLLTLATLAIIFIAGEEISWGQRIFNWRTPAKYAQLNMQSETNIHNNQGIFGLSMRIYVLIGAYASFAWIIKPLVHKKLTADLNILLFPIPSLMTYFLPTLVYNYYRTSIDGPPMHKWEEVTELLLYMGILAHLYFSYIHIQKQPRVLK